MIQRFSSPNGSVITVNNGYVTQDAQVPAPQAGFIANPIQSRSGGAVNTPTTQLSNVPIMFPKRTTSFLPAQTADSSSGSGGEVSQPTTTFSLPTFEPPATNNTSQTAWQGMAFNPFM
ncbi:MAG: hypothetical protein ACYC97_02135 [Metallibacterium sp.]